MKEDERNYNIRSEKKIMTMTNIIKNTVNNVYLSCWTYQSNIFITFSKAQFNVWLL